MSTTAVKKKCMGSAGCHVAVKRTIKHRMNYICNIKKNKVKPKYGQMKEEKKSCVRKH